MLQLSFENYGESPDWSTSITGPVLLRRPSNQPEGGKKKRWWFWVDDAKDPPMSLSTSWRSRQASTFWMALLELKAREARWYKKLLTFNELPTFLMATLLHSSSSSSSSVTLLAAAIIGKSSSLLRWPLPWRERRPASASASSASARWPRRGNVMPSPRPVGIGMNQNSWRSPKTSCKKTFFYIKTWPSSWGLIAWSVQIVADQIVAPREKS